MSERPCSPALFFKFGLLISVQSLRIGAGPQALRTLVSFTTFSCMTTKKDLGYTQIVVEAAIQLSEHLFIFRFLWGACSGAI